MGRYAVISDIHGNRHALEAVLRDVAGRDVDEMICLGDIVGYGPAPDACLDLVMKYCSIVIRGNHDQAVIDLNCAATFNGIARQAIEWTLRSLGPLHMNAINRLQAVAYVDDHVMCVHDCPVPGPSDYVHDAIMASMAFSAVDRPVCLLGHTHVPAVFEAPTASSRDAVRPDMVIVRTPEPDVPIALDPGRRYICNPGSVGQPRDADPRASYAVLDLDARTFTLHRREYDVTAAQSETHEAGLPAILAERLAIGA